MTGLARWSAFLREQILRGLFPVALVWASFAPLILVNAGLLYASVAAPLGAVFTAWWSLRRKGWDQT